MSICEFFLVCFALVGGAGHTLETSPSHSSNLGHYTHTSSKAGTQPFLSSCFKAEEQSPVYIHPYRVAHTALSIPAFSMINVYDESRAEQTPVLAPLIQGKYILKTSIIMLAMIEQGVEADGGWRNQCKPFLNIEPKSSSTAKTPILNSS